MSSRLWFARDAGFTADPKVQALGDEHGPGGPLTVEEMIAVAKLEGNHGSLSVSYASLARRSFITPQKAKRIVADAARLGIIEITEQTSKGIVATLPKWARWQSSDPAAAERKRQYRSRQASRESHGEVT